MKRRGFRLARIALLIACLAVMPSPLPANPPQGANTGDGSTPFTGLAQAPEANLFVGAATLSVPIEVPPGRGAMTPRLGLNYNSSIRQTPFGYGWDLPIGKIQRCLKRGVLSCHDPTYRNDFVLDLPTGTIECTLDADGRCRPVVEESFLRIDYRAADNSWQVLDRDGNRYIFGDVAAARTGSDVTSLFVPEVPSSPWQPYVPCKYTSGWALTRVVDPNGNDINYSYVNAKGVLYPQLIQYGGNPAGGVAAMFDVVFGWEDYSGRGPLNAAAGFVAEVSKRLESIEVRYLGATVRRYDVGYSPLFTSDHELQFLQDVMLSSPDGPLLNTDGDPARTSFLYRRDSGDPDIATFRPAHHAPVLPISNPSRLRVENITATVRGVVRDVLDMNGDGFVDLVDIIACDGPWEVYLGGPAGFSTTAIQWSVPFCAFVRTTDTAGSVADVPVQAFDIDGDSIPDLVDGLHACTGFDCDYSYWRVYRGRVGVGQTGWGFDETYIEWPKPSEPEIEDIYLRRTIALEGINIAGWSHPVVTQRDLIDMNADGLVDLVSTASGVWRVWYNTGAGFEASAAEFPAPYPYLRVVSSAGDEMIGVYDINGDGLPDQVVGCDRSVHLDCEVGLFGGPLWKVYLNTGHEMRMAPDLWTFGTQSLKAGIRRVQSQRVVRDLFDINGDGLPDVVETRADNNWNVYLNAGFDFRVQAQVWVVGSNRIRDANSDGLTEKDTFDVDGDGLVDFVDFDPSTNDAPTAIVTKRNASGAWCGSSDGLTCSAASGTTLLAANAEAGQPNALVQMENGIGGTTYLEYRPSTDWDNTDEHGLPRLPLPLWTLTAIESDDGLCNADGTACVGAAGAAHSVRSEFRYRGGFYEYRSRDFRGFAAVERRDAEGNLTTTRFHQDAVRRGKVEVAERFAADPIDPYLRPIDQTAPFWGCADLDAGDEVPCPDGPLAAPVWVRETGSQTITYSDFDSSQGEWELAFRFSWNQCAGEFTGDASLVMSLASDDTTALTQTDYACASEAHVLGKPIHILKQDAGTIGVEESWFLYDGDAAGNPLPFGTLARGQVTRIESWIDTPSSLMLALPCTADSSKVCIRVGRRYDNLGNMVSTTDANGHTTQIAYGAASHHLYPSLTTNAAGHKVGTGYDVACGKLAWQTQAYVTALPPDDPSHPRTQRRYDSFCRLERTAHADEDIDESPHEIFLYELGAVQKPTAMKVFTAEPYFSGTYDPQSPEGQILPSSHYLPATTLTDALGRPIQRLRRDVVNSLPVSLAAVTMSYDERGLLARQYMPFVVTTGIEQFAVPGAAAGFEALAHDAVGRVVTQTNPDGGLRRWHRNVAWQTTAEDECYADPSCAGGRSIEIYDSRGHVVEKQIHTQNGSGESLAAKTRYAYDTLGRLLSSEQWNGTAWDPASRIVHTYDSLGRRISLADPDSGLWRYGYDAAGNLRWQDDPKPGQHVQMCYDVIDRITKKYVFTNVDFSESFITCGFTATVEYEYDNSTDANGLGRLAVVDDPSGSTWFTYDLRGRVIGVNKGIVVRHDPPMLDEPAEWASFLYAYDVADRLVSVRYPDGEIVAHGYDGAGRINRLENDSGTVYLENLTYDLFGRRRRIFHGDSTFDERTYHLDKANGYRLSSITTKKGSARYVDFAYTAYTRTGLIKQIDDRAHPSSADVLSSTVTYEYDGLGRLVRATGHNLSAAPNDRYAYNALGNMMLKEGRTFTYNPARPHQLMAIDGNATGIAHDENGSRLGKAGETYAYDAEGRLASINAGAVSIQYDYSGRQVAKYTAAPAQTTRYFNELAESRDGKLVKSYFAGDLRIASTENADWQVAAAAAADGKMLASILPPAVGARWVTSDALTGMLALGAVIGLFAAPGRKRLGLGMKVRRGRMLLLIGIWLTATVPAPLALYAPLGVGVAVAFPPGGGCTTCPTTTTTHYHVDHLGSTLLVTRGGAITEHIRYEPYGGVRLRSTGTGVAVDAAAHPYEFTGYETDVTSGLQYAGARFYDPELGSFLTHDPQRQFPSPYAYGSWNPVNGVDPDGEFFFLVPILAAALDAVLAVISAVQVLIPHLLTHLEPVVLAAAKGAATGLFKGAVQAISTGEPKALLEGLKNGAISGAVSGLVFDSTGFGDALDGVSGDALSLNDFLSPSPSFLAEAGAIGVQGAFAGAVRGYVGSLALATVQGGDPREQVLQGTTSGAIGGAFGNLFQPAVDEISQAALGPITNEVGRALGVSSILAPRSETVGSLLQGGIPRQLAGGALAESHTGVGKFLKGGLSNLGRFDPGDLAGGAVDGVKDRAKLVFHDQVKQFSGHHAQPSLESPLVNR